MSQRMKDTSWFHLLLFEVPKRTLRTQTLFGRCVFRAVESVSPGSSNYPPMIGVPRSSLTNSQGVPQALQGNKAAEFSQDIRWMTVSVLSGRIAELFSPQLLPLIIE